MQRGPDAVDRRTLVLGGTAVAASAVAGAVAAGAAAGLGRAVGGAKSPGARDVRSLAAPHRPGRHHDFGTGGHHHDDWRRDRGARRSAWPARCPSEAATFTDPATGDPGLVLQLTKGQFVAYDAVCPHAGCTVGYSPGARLIVCPCHGSEFDPTTGAVISPPAPRGLTQIHLAVNANGELLADG